MINNINGYIGITIPARGATGLDGTVTIDEILSHPSDYDECVVTLANIVNDVSNGKLINKPIFIMDRIEGSVSPINTFLHVKLGAGGIKEIIIPTAFYPNIEDGKLDIVARITFDTTTRTMNHIEI